MEPGAIYYIVLYTLIIVLQFFKTFPKVNEGPHSPNWRHYFFVSLEVVYTSAGLVILLVLQGKDWIPVIMMVYVMLVVISSFLDSVGAKFKENTRFGIHIAIITVVVFVTIFAYAKVLPKSAVQHHKQPIDYKVLLPYRDLAFERHVGSNVSERIFLYSTKVKGVSTNDAIQKAKDKALSDEADSIKPFGSKKTMPKAVILISEEAIAIEYLSSDQK